MVNWKESPLFQNHISQERDKVPPTLFRKEENDDN